MSIKRDIKLPNIVWHRFNLQSWHVPNLWIDFGTVRHKRKSSPNFNYDVREFYIQLGSAFISKDIIGISLFTNQSQMLKYLHQEWSLTKELIQGMLIKW